MFAVQRGEGLLDGRQRLIEADPKAWVIGGVDLEGSAEADQVEVAAADVGSSARRRETKGEEGVV